MGFGTNRRTFLRQATAIAGVATLTRRRGTQVLAAEKPYRIDVHHHILPPEYIRQVGGSVIGAPAGRTSASPWSVASAVKTMDRLDIGTAITSISAPGFPLHDDGKIRRLARACNDFAKQMATDHPGRFGVFATLPLPDVTSSVNEINYAFDVLSADGIVLYTNYRDLYLGDATFQTVMAELHHRRAVVFVHPTVCQCSVGLLPNIPASVIEFPHDTTRTVTSMLFNRTFERYPGIRFIFSHAGGTVPFLVNRMGLLPDVGRGILPLLKRQYYDLALSANPQAMSALLATVDISQVLMGTDFPFAPAERVAGVIAGIGSSSLDARRKRMVEHDNAVALFPRFAS